VDRQAFERLFQVKDRRARNLMRRFGGDTRIGNAWAIKRERLIEALARMSHRPLVSGKRNAEMEFLKVT